jgi:RHS repeat-associated protein
MNQPRIQTMKQTILALLARVRASATRPVVTAMIASILLAGLSSVALAQQTNPQISWSYGRGTYSTQAAAVAAMQSDPANPQNVELTVQSSASNLSQTTIQYNYTAPTPLPASGPTVYWGGGPVVSTAQAAVQYELTHTFAPQYLENMCGNPGGNAVPDGAPVFESDLGSPSFGPGYVINYDFDWWSGDIFATPECAMVVSQDAIQISEWVANSCPAYYSLSGSQCIDSDTAFITATILPCVKCAAPGTSTQVADPIDAGSGDYLRTETDYSSAGLSFTRYYHSATLEGFHAMGVGWTHQYAAQAVISGGQIAGLLRPNGYHDPLISEGNGLFVASSGDGIHAQASGSNWLVTLPDGSEELYNSTGTLIELIGGNGQVTMLSYTNNALSSVVGPFGHTLTFAYNNAGLISGITDPAGNVIAYAYDGNNNLVSVTYQDGTSRSYQYGNRFFPNDLTGVVDESGSLVSAITYDTSGRAVGEQGPGGAGAVSIAYASTISTVTDALEGSTVFTFANPSSTTMPRLSGVSLNGLTRSYVLPSVSADPQLRATQLTDENGNVSNYAYDADHLTSQTEAVGTSIARTTSYQYLSSSSTLPTLVTEALRQTSYSYYSGTSLVQTKTVIDTSVTPNVSRSWNYTYDSYGRMLTAKGPRTDVNSTTTYAYYTCTSGAQCGQAQTITDAVGNVTTYNSYNAYGQPLSITDPNGVVTTLTYDVRQHLLSRSTAGEVTTFAYHPTGLLETITSPDGSTLTYVYDGAHRLTEIKDGAGNSMQYTLDGMGNRIAESRVDASNTLSLALSRVYNSLNRLAEQIGSAGTAAVTTTYAYDNVGNQIGINAPLNRNTSKAYDALNRLSQVTDASNGVTSFAYDANDNLLTVADPAGLTTSYQYDGFGDVLQIGSPATARSTNAYDSAGNLAATQDARGVGGTYSYDAANRPIQVAYGDQTIAYGYDTGTNGKGRLTSASDANHAMSWAYDALGRVTAKSQSVSNVTLSTGYTYTNGDLTALTTPSGQSIAYSYTNHQISSIAVNGTALLSGTGYEAFGPTLGWTWGNGTSEIRLHDTDGNPSQITGAESISYSVDSAFRIVGITDAANSALSYTYSYDSLDRLTSADTASSSLSWTYDADGNRQSQTNASPPPSTTSFFVYNNRGRLISATTSLGAINSIYNALGQRIEKASSTSQTLFYYDESGHLIGEYDGGGNLIEETVWMGDLPVATIKPNGAGSVNVFYIHADHLGAPKSITQPSSNAIVWRWDSDPLGTTSPNQNPTNQGTFVYNLRFPGQYYDQETGLNYNYFRDYDPSVGRYIESDPSGLKGGVNTYAYVTNSPIGFFDPDGLLSQAVAQCVCSFMKANGYSAFMAFGAANRKRQSPGPWNDPVLRPCENYLYAYASVVDYGDPAWLVKAGVFGHDLLKRIGRSDTTPPSPEATAAGYEGASDGAAHKDWKKQCDGCKSQ